MTYITLTRHSAKTISIHSITLWCTVHGHKLYPHDSLECLRCDGGRYCQHARDDHRHIAICDMLSYHPTLRWHGRRKEITLVIPFYRACRYAVVAVTTWIDGHQEKEDGQDGQRNGGKHHFHSMGLWQQSKHHVIRLPIVTWKYAATVPGWITHNLKEEPTGKQLKKCRNGELCSVRDRLAFTSNSYW